MKQYRIMSVVPSTLTIKYTPLRSKTAPTSTIDQKLQVFFYQKEQLPSAGVLLQILYVDVTSYELTIVHERPLSVQYWPFM